MPFSSRTLARGRAAEKWTEHQPERSPTAGVEHQTSLGWQAAAPGRTEDGSWLLTRLLNLEVGCWVDASLPDLSYDWTTLGLRSWPTSTLAKFGGVVWNEICEFTGRPELHPAPGLDAMWLRSAGAREVTRPSHARTMPPGRPADAGGDDGLA